MPEIFRTEINKGFISIWKLSESIDFFINSVEIETLNAFKKKIESEKRLKEKFAPHHILKKFDSSLILNNLERKPRVNTGFVSVSHCNDYIAVAYNLSSEIGIDIEYYGDRILKIIHKFLTKEENEYCQKDATKCLMVWAAKEAIFKKYGEETTFFKSSLFIEPFEITEKQVMHAKIKYKKNLVEDTLVCELFNDFVLVYTN